jgi:hypothetical protein
VLHQPRELNERLVAAVLGLLERRQPVVLE